MKIVFFWTGDFSANILAKLSEYPDVSIDLVVSQPDKRVGRSKGVQETAVKKLALWKGFRVLQPERLKGNTEFLEEIKRVAPDFLVVVAYGKMITQEILDTPKYYALNLHGSLLPKYRWASPIQESLKRGDIETWLTIMQMILWMDEGPCFKQAKIKVDNVDNTLSIFKKFAQEWPELLHQTLQEIILDNIQPTPQDHALASYCEKIQKEDGKIHFGKYSAKEVCDLIRAYTPWPWVYAYYQQKKFVVEDAQYIDEIHASPGQVVELPNKDVGVGCFHGTLILKKVKLEWKKSMDINSFINGHKNILQYKFD